ncbi:MAG TPA: hypothetical protein VKG25_06460, partial [Bryobacteraceae bacterium]|nr:hypothetical protein [Bryobacteraceae bacterium]
VQTDLSGIAAAYYADPVSIAAGGAFALTIPYDLTLDSSASSGTVRGTVSVNVFNTVGPAGNQTVSACQ